jgi:multidrug efflux pump subunit AcrA (membrane-fusion protein)
LPLKAQYFKASDELRRLIKQNGAGRNGKGRNATDTMPVWVMPESGVPEVRSVQIGIANQDYIEILSGEVKSGDRVIVGIQGESGNDSGGAGSRRGGSVRMRF